MFGGASHCRMPLSPEPPQMPKREYSENPEKYADNLQPKYPGEPHKRTPYRLAEATGPGLQTFTHLARPANALGHSVGSFRGRSLRCGFDCPACRLGAPRSRPRLTGIRRRDSLARRVLRRSRVHCARYRLHRLSRPNSKRTSKANRVHLRSVDSHPQSAKVIAAAAGRSVCIFCALLARSEECRHCLPASPCDRTRRLGDQVDVRPGVDLHSNVGSPNSSVFVSTRKDNIKLSSRTGIELAITARESGRQSSGGT